MTDLHQILYQFLWEHRFPVHDPEDSELSVVEQRQEETLRASLTPDQAEQLDALLDTLEELLCLQQVLMFQAALSLDVELSRL